MVRLLNSFRKWLNMTTQRYTPKTDGEIKAICEVLNALNEWNHPDESGQKVSDAMARHYHISPEQRDAYNSIRPEEWVKLSEQFQLRNFRRPDDVPMIRNADIAKELFTPAQYEAYAKVQATFAIASDAMWKCLRDLPKQVAEHGAVEVPSLAIDHIRRLNQQMR